MIIMVHIHVITDYEVSMDEGTKEFKGYLMAELTRHKGNTNTITNSYVPILDRPQLPMNESSQQ